MNGSTAVRQDVLDCVKLCMIRLVHVAGEDRRERVVWKDKTVKQENL